MTKSKTNQLSIAVLAALIIPVIAAQVQSEQQQQQEKFFMIIKAQGAVRYKPYNITTNLANTLLPQHNNNSNLKIQYD
jgi:hypothetical protein